MGVSYACPSVCECVCACSYDLHAPESTLFNTGVHSGSKDLKVSSKPVYEQAVLSAYSIMYSLFNIIMAAI